MGYKRVKRGYRQLEEQLGMLDFTDSFQSPTDPYYQYQWYLVSRGALVLTMKSTLHTWKHRTNESAYYFRLCMS